MEAAFEIHTSDFISEWPGLAAWLEASLGAGGCTGDTARAPTAFNAGINCPLRDAILGPFLATAPTLQLVHGGNAARCWSILGPGALRSLLRLYTLRAATHHPLRHVHTPTSVQTSCTRACSLNRCSLQHSLIPPLKPLPQQCDFPLTLVPAYLEEQCPGEQWGGTRTLQESSPSFGASGKISAMLLTQKCFLGHTTQRALWGG